MKLIRRILEERWLYYIGYFGLGLGLAWGKAFLSISVGVLLGAWVFERIFLGDFKYQWERLRVDRRAVGSLLLFIAISASVLWSSDMSQAWFIWKTMLPLWLLTPVFFGSPALPDLHRRQLYLLHLLALGTSIAFTLVHARQHGLLEGDPREWRYFSSHIRLGLLLVLGVSGCWWLSKDVEGLRRYALWLLALWFSVFLLRASLMTGTFLGLILLVLSVLFHKNIRFWKRAILLAPMLVLFSYAWYISGDHFRPKEAATVDIEAQSSSGRAYRHDLQNDLLQDGHYVYRYIQDEELIAAWSERSDMPFDASGYLFDRLLRYLSSKGLRKDRKAIESLGEGEIAAIEKGAFSANPPKNPIARRIDGLFYEWSSYQNGGDPSLSSMMRRFEFWRGSIHAITEAPLSGYGAGDVQPALDEAYALRGRLEPSAWHLSHNQYLSFFLMSGAPLGLLAILGLLLFSGLLSKRSCHPLLYPFLCVYLLSCMTENSMESQVGLGILLYYIGFVTNWSAPTPT